MKPAPWGHRRSQDGCEELWLGVSHPPDPDSSGEAQTRSQTSLYYKERGGSTQYSRSRSQLGDKSNLEDSNNQSPKLAFCGFIPSLWFLHCYQTLALLLHKPVDVSGGMLRDRETEQFFLGHFCSLKFATTL